MTSRRCCCGCSCECSICTGSDQTTVCCWILYLEGVEAPSSGENCASCPPGTTSTICVLFYKTDDCTWGVRSGEYAPCGSGLDYDEYSLTLTEDSGPGSNVTMDITTPDGGSFELSLGEDPDCCITDKRELTVNAFPSWECDFSSATAYIQGSDNCYGCYSSINYGGWLKLDGFATPSGECGCHGTTGCTDLNGRLLKFISGAGYTAGACTGTGWYETASFSTPGCLNKDYQYGEDAPNGITDPLSGDTYEPKNSVCGYYGFYTNRVAVDNESYTSEISAKVSVLLTSGTAEGYEAGSNGYPIGGNWALFEGTVTIPSTFLAGNLNRVNEWFRLNPLILTFIEWKNRKAFCAQANKGQEHFCDMSSATIEYWVDFGNPSSDQACGNSDFPWEYCDPAWCHEDGAWEERTITLPSNIYIGTSAPYPAACYHPGGDYIISNDDNCFSGGDDYSWGACYLLPHTSGTGGYVDGTQLVLTLETSGSQYYYKLIVKPLFSGGAYDSIFWEYEFRSANFSLPLCTGAQANADIECGELEGDTITLAYYTSRRDDWPSYSSTSPITPSSVTLEYTLLGTYTP